jgi:hypothetical protein
VTVRSRPGLILLEDIARVEQVPHAETCSSKVTAP